MSLRLNLIIGVILAFVAVILTRVYLDQQRQIIQGQARQAIAQVQKSQTAVLVAKQGIPKGATIGSAMLEAAIIPNQHVSPGSVSSFEKIKGMIAVAAIDKGEQITTSKLAFGRDVSSTASLASATPVGKRAITIPVDNISSVGGMIKPGDYVDVLCVVAAPTPAAAGTPSGKTPATEIIAPIFQNVLVLAVGQEVSTAQDADKKQKTKEKETVSPIITLALNPQEANLIAFVQEKGKIRLVLRSPIDSQLQPVYPASWETLLQYLNLLPPPPPPTEKEEIRTIEIFRGQQKEVVPLVGAHQGIGDK